MVFGRAASSNVQMVKWGAAELGLKVERLNYGHVYGGTDTVEFLDHVMVSYDSLRVGGA